MPLARAAAAAGHAVAVATGEPIRGVAEADGFEALSAAPGFAAIREAFVAKFGPLDEIPPEQHRSFFFGRVFTGIELPVRLPELLAIADKWQPDLIVHELSEFALSADRGNSPGHTACHLRVRAVARARDCLCGGSVGRRALPGGRARARSSTALSLALPRPVPAKSAGTRRQRDRAADRHQAGAAGTDAAAEPAWSTAAERPTVYVTLGTVWNQDLSVFRIVLEGLAHRPVNVIAALGPGKEAADLGPQPPNVRVCGFIPHAQLLGHCDLVICHGGAGSVLDSLSAGLPLLIAPQAADHFYNASRVAAAGAGRCLHRADLTPASVSRDLDVLLQDAGYRDAAARIAAEIAAMPSARDALTALTALADG